jgi:ribosomal-protein-alanine N-acetyltransferase
MSCPEFQLRPALAADLDAIVALERATPTASRWSPAVYAAALASAAEAETAPPQAPAPRRCLIVAHTGGSLAGFAVGSAPPSPRVPAAGLGLQPRLSQVAELETVVVATSARRVGIGRALCTAVLVWCRAQGATAVVLEVRADSAGTIALYAALGFILAGRRPHYYRDPEDDALLLRLDLN